MQLTNIIQEPVSAKDFWFHTPSSLELPTNVDLRQYSGDIEDQKRLGSCVANATVSALEMILQRAGKFTHLSRLFVYYYARADYATLRGKDNGAYLSDGFKTCYRFGVPPEEIWPYDESQVNAKPPTEADTAASNYKVSRYQRVAQFANNSNVQRIRTALSLGYPVTVSISVKNSLYLIKGKLFSDECTYSGIGEPIGGHAMCLVGYTPTGFICENSWGTDWGDNGFCLISNQVINNDLMDAWMCSSFAGINQPPDFTFTQSKPLTVTLSDWQQTQYLTSSSTTTLYSNMLAARPDGEGPFAFQWTSSDPSCTVQDVQFPVPKIDMTGWKHSETRSITLTCTVQDSSIPAQEATAYTLIRVCNGIEIDSSYGKIYRLYKTSFARVPDDGGLQYWMRQINNGLELRDIAARFMDSEEFKNLYGTNVNDIDFLTLLYKNVLNRAPDQAGFQWWINQLTNGLSRQDTLVSFSESEENKNNVFW